MASTAIGCDFRVVYQVFRSDRRIRGRRVSGGGVPPWPTRQGRQGSDVDIGVDGSSGNVLPAVAYDPRAGEYLVAWQVTGSGGDNDVRARRVAADGTPVGDTFVVSVAAGSQQEAPAVGFGEQASLAVWQDNASSSWVVYGRQYGAQVADFAAAPPSGSAPLAVSFADLSMPPGAADEWRWAFGTGMSSTLASPVYTYTLPGVYTVTQWVTDTASGATDVLTRGGYITVTSESATAITTTINYDYDPLYRLVEAVYSSGEVYTYTYDAVGNRLAKGVDGQVTEYLYDDANRLTSAGGVEYTWDQNGNLLDDGERAYSYDTANRLIQVVSGTFTTTFVYNGDGHRVAKAENGVTTSYVVAILGLSQVLLETTGGQTTRYVYGHDLLAEYDGAAWAWYLNDGLGSVRQLADSDGEVTLAQGYTPSGVPLWSEGSGETGYGFTGEQWEAYAGLLFLRARYYEPGVGRFLNPDSSEPSVSHPSTLNFYCYALNNPVAYFDPSGYWPACPGSCPCPAPQTGKFWSFVGKWGVSVYGNADHELWQSVDQETIEWTGLDGKTHSATVFSSWVRNIQGQGVAGRLKTDNDYVWIECHKGNPMCTERTESYATHGHMPEYQAVAINPCPSDIGIPRRYCRKDGVDKGSTLCIDGLPNNVLTVKDYGRGQPGWDQDPERKREWVDLWMGLHGPDYAHFPGMRSVWVLKDIPIFTCPDQWPCPI